MNWVKNIRRQYKSKIIFDFFLKLDGAISLCSCDKRSDSEVRMQEV